jgi:lipopolysaccharide transport system permease protein
VPSVRPTSGPVFEASDGRLIQPRNFLSEAWRSRPLLAYWFRRNLIARYRQTTLGPLLVVLLPVLSSLVYGFVFSLLLRVQTDVPYVLFAMTNLSLWMYTTRSLQTGPANLLSNIDLVTRARFPREFLPLGVWGESIVDLFVALALMAVIALMFGITPGPAIVMAPVVFIVHSMLTVGLMFIVAAVGIRVRDLGYLLPIALQLALYLAPILYPIDLIPEKWRFWYMLNPFAAIFGAYQEAFYQDRFTLTTELGVAAAVAVVALVFGYRLFKRQEWLLADQL